MRIGVLTTSFPRRTGDVAGDFVLGFARALATRGHTLEVLAPEPAEDLAPPRWPGIDVRFVPYLRPRRAARTFYGAGVPDNLRRDPMAWLGLAPFTAALLSAAWRRRASWDALISHWALPCALVAGAIRENRPHVAVLHSADLHLMSRLPLRSRCAELVARGADRLLFVSERQRRDFMGWLRPELRPLVQSHVQAMGFEAAHDPIADRAVLRRRLGLDRFTLLTLARLVPVKGLAEAITSLRDRGDLTWLIAGDGPERARLAELARSMRLQVRLLGTVTGADKRALFQASDAFVLPSRVLASGRSEGMPTALLEAMAHGLPAVASDVGGVSEFVRHLETGMLLEPSVPQALQRCVDLLSSEPTLGKNLAARAQRDLVHQSWDAIAPRLDAILRGAAASALARQPTIDCQ
jgi:glycosyltransferase involved in cell wall biosynthesis